MHVELASLQPDTVSRLNNLIPFEKLSYPRTLSEFAVSLGPQHALFYGSVKHLVNLYSKIDGTRTCVVL